MHFSADHSPIEARITDPQEAHLSSCRAAYVRPPAPSTSRFAWKRHHWRETAYSVAVGGAPAHPRHVTKLREPQTGRRRSVWVISATEQLHRGAGRQHTRQNPRPLHLRKER